MRTTSSTQAHGSRGWCFLACLFSFLFIALSPLSAQTDSLTAYISRFITLDSVFVTASKSELNLRDLINLVQKDLSFYRAFYNLRITSHIQQSDARFYNRKGHQKARRQMHVRQWSDGQCRVTQVIWEKTEGRFFSRKKTHRYYTSELYDYLFFTTDTICTSTKTDNWKPRDTRKLHGRDKQIEELKKLLFATGQPANIPLLGDKAAIFSEKMVQRYDYQINSDTLDGYPAYHFSAQAKPQLAPSKTVIKSFDIWFQRGNLQVLRRKFYLYARTPFYDFDVKFDITLQEKNGYYLPKTIEYDGWWKIPFQQLEKAKISTAFF